MSGGAVYREAVWAIRGEVVHGHGRGGTQLGFPTANIGLNDAVTTALLPLQNWVYYGWGCVEGLVEDQASVVYPLVMSVGFNPHFKDKALTVEAYFLHKFPSDFYGRVARIVSCGPIREQGAFTTIDALIETISNDCVLAQERLRADDALQWKQHWFLAGAGATGQLSRDAGSAAVPEFHANLRTVSSL